jgi:Ca-activated chloride channel family protein
MRVKAVDTFRTGLEPSPPTKARKGSQRTLHVVRREALWVAGLAVGAVLAIGVVAQDSSLGSSSLPPVSTQQPASPSAPGATVSSQDPASTQQPDTEEGQFVFRKKVEEVTLHAVAVDQQNRLIPNLSRDAFSIYEDGKLQKMTSFRQENVSLALGILIDNSGSMLPKRQKVNEAALNLVRSSNARDEVFVVNFGEDYYLDQDFTDDVAKLKAALDKVETRGSTALYDAIVASAGHIRQNTNIQKRVLLVVTDGKDNASQESLDESVQQLQRGDGPVIYVIAFVDETKSASSTIRALQSISMKTGGTAYFPKDLSQVDAITKSIASDIRNQYVIAYKSSNPTAGHTYHPIEVQAQDASRHQLRVRTRTGYYSDSPSESSQ